MSKFAIILFISGICTLVLFTSGLVAGLLYSHVTDLKYIFSEMEFLLAYFVQLVVFSMFAFSIALVIKKAGFAIVFVCLYSLFFEPITTAIMVYSPLNVYTLEYVKFFPIYAINNLIDIPFPKYIFQEINDDVLWYEWIIALGWGTLFALFITYILNKRDLKA